MTELSEIVFEDIYLNELVDLANELLYPNIITAKLNGKTINRSIHCAIFNIKDGDEIFFNLNKISYNNLEIKFPSAQIVRYNNKLDLNIIFYIGGLSALKLKKFSKKISEKFKIDIFYAGLEPACDCETRYFTGDRLGPLAKKYT